MFACYTLSTLLTLSLTAIIGLQLVEQDSHLVSRRQAAWAGHLLLSLATLMRLFRLSLLAAEPNGCCTTSEAAAAAPPQVSAGLGWRLCRLNSELSNVNSLACGKAGVSGKILPNLTA